MPFRTLFGIFLLIEFVSYTAYFFPTLNAVGFFVIVGAALVLAMRRLEYGLYFVLADLILGGKSGALFAFEYGGFFLSLRMALFIVVMGVWVGKATVGRPERSEGSHTNVWTRMREIFFGLRPQNDMLFFWGVLGLAVGWGMVVGLVRGNNFGNLFLDANGYFYGALILPFWWVARWEPNYESTRILRIRNIRTYSPFGSFGIVFFAATTLLALKTLFAVYIFTHAGNNFIAANLVPFYRWVRDTGVGEITWLPGNFARVFFQSQIYNIMAFFVLLAFARDSSACGLRMTKLRSYTLLALNIAVILVSLSRSFWVGVAIGLVVLGIGQIRRIRQIGQNILIAGIAAVVLLFVVARFPLPRPSAMDLSLAAQSRLTFEPGAASRWNLLPEMWKTVREHPILGSGFGRTITYISNDPRIREVNPAGEYTTYAFEWGWLDFWLKMGLIGLMGPIGLIFALARTLYKKAVLAALAVLAVVATIHFFTPYLNHPLGIGILILATLYVIPNQNSATR